MDFFLLSSYLYPILLMIYRLLLTSLIDLVWYILYKSKFPINSSISYRAKRTHPILFYQFRIDIITLFETRSTKVSAALHTFSIYIGSPNRFQNIVNLPAINMSYGKVNMLYCKTTNTFRALKLIKKDNYQKTDNYVDKIEIIKK